MAEGLRGTIDFVGYGAGQPGAAPPAAGFLGLLDFIGFSVGVTAGGPGGGTASEWLIRARRRGRR